MARPYVCTRGLEPRHRVESRGPALSFQGRGPGAVRLTFCRGPRALVSSNDESASQRRQRRHAGAQPPPHAGQPCDLHAGGAQTATPALTGCCAEPHNTLTQLSTKTLLWARLGSAPFTHAVQAGPEIMEREMEREMESPSA